MEIKVNIDTEEQASMLYRLKLNGDIYPGYARLFVTPVEVERIKSLNFDYEVLIPPTLTNIMRTFGKHVMPITPTMKSSSLPTAW